MTQDIYKTVCAKLLQVDLTPLDLCCLCFNLVGGDGSSVDDVVMLSFQTGGIVVARKISEILKRLINKNISEVMYVLKLVCKQCLRTAIDGYKLIQNSKMNMKILYDAVDNLEHSLSDLPADMYNCKSLYVAIKPKEISKKCIVKRYFDKKQQFVPQDTALLRFKMILEQPKSGICSKTNIETKDILYDSSKPNEYKCVICQEVFGNSTCLRLHFFRQHHHSKDVQCNECYRHLDQVLLLDDINEATELQNESKLDKVELSPESTPFQDCVETFNFVNSPPVQSEVVVTSDTVQLEENTETEPSYTCTNCKMTFKELYLYKKHKRRKSNCKLVKFYCDYCNCCYSNKDNLKKHISYKHMGKGWPCEYCGNVFISLSYLKRHIMMHTKEKSAVCTECGKAFLDKNYLKLHMEIHSGEKSYQCDICNKSFLNSYRLTTHVYTHKPKVECKFCHKLFKHSSMGKHLQRFHFANITSSLSDKPILSCQYCNISTVFVSNSELQDHIRTHKDPEQQCNICFKKFTRKKNLNNHKKRHLNKKKRRRIKNISTTPTFDLNTEV